MAHGTGACLVSHGQSEELTKALKAVGNTPTFVLHDGYSHGDPGYETNDSNRALKLIAQVFGR